MRLEFKHSQIKKQTTEKLTHNVYGFDENNKDKVYINDRPAQAVSFGGSAVLGTKKLAGRFASNLRNVKIGETISKGLNKTGDAFMQSGPINKLIDFVYDNETAYNAIYSLLIAGILKPLLVLKTKDADEKDKQLIAVKNFLSAFLGSFLSFTISGKIINKAVDITKNNRKLIKVTDDLKIKVVEKDSSAALDLAEDVLIKQHNVFKDKLGLAKKAYSENTGIRKVLRFFGALFKKTEEFKPGSDEIAKKAEELVETCKRHVNIFEKNPNLLKKLKDEFKAANYKDTISNAYDALWKNIAGTPITIFKAKISSLLLPGIVAFIFAKKNFEAQQNKEKEAKAKIGSTLEASENFKNTKKMFEQYMNNSSKNLSFKGSSASLVIDKIAGVIEQASMSRFGEKCVESLAKLPKPSARMGDFESFCLTLFWCVNTNHSKKIEPDQKLGLNVQSVLVSVASSLASFILDTSLDGLIEKGKNRYSGLIQNNIMNLADEIKKGKQVTDLSAEIMNACRKLNNPKGIAKAILKRKDFDINNVKQVEEVANEVARKYANKLKKFKSLTIFTLVVRFLVPVLMVKPAGKLKLKIKKMQQERQKNLMNISKGNLKEKIDEKNNVSKIKEKDDD